MVGLVWAEKRAFTKIINGKNIFQKNESEDSVLCT